MKYDPINPAAQILDQSVASDCGELAVGCSDAAGRIKLATDQMDRQIGELGRPGPRHDEVGGAPVALDHGGAAVHEHEDDRRAVDGAGSSYAGCARKGLPPSVVLRQPLRAVARRWRLRRT